MSNPDWTDEKLTPLIGLLQQLARADEETLAKIQAHGVDVLPVNFYSSTPSLEDIEKSFEYRESEPPYFDERIFDPASLRATLDRLLPFAAEFCPPIEGNEENPAGFFWKNSQFSFSDALAYYCLLRLMPPPAVVEIGAGFSTLVALEALEKNGRGVVHCIDPFPRDFLRRESRVTLHPTRAQDVSPAALNDLLEDGSVLFIDSTHTVKTGSDCLHIFLRLLPRVERNILVHVHDVFLPFGMPREWLTKHRIFWTEQYLLLAFLIDNPKATVLYGSEFNARWNPAAMDKLMGGKCRAGGGSLWFRYDARGGGGPASSG